MDASTRRRRPLPSLTEELFEEILLRFPPEEPKFLFRATIVCKDWRLLLSSARFRRRFCEHHQTAPMLGYSTSYFGFKPVTKSPFASLSEVKSIWRQPIDTLAGRILFDEWGTGNIAPGRINLAVWNTMDGDVRRLPDPEPDELPPLPNGWSAALVCTAPSCGHLDCAGNGPFQVVLVVDMTSWSDKFSSAATYVYSSEHHNAWSNNPVTVQLPYPGDRDGIAIGPAARSQNALYFICSKKRNPVLGHILGEKEHINTILKYDLGKQEPSLVSVPSAACKDRYTALVILDDATLGFATVRQYKLNIWSRNTDLDGEARWSQLRVIELNTVRTSAASARSASPRVLPAANSVGVIFITTSELCFIVDLKSGRVSRLFQGWDIVPFRSFCTPGTNKIIRPII